MLFYVQYNDKLVDLDVPYVRRLGDLYGLIVEKLHIYSRNVVHMIHDSEIIGISPLNFEKKIYQTNLHEGSLIFVILNHYPNLTEINVQMTNILYQKWLERDVLLEEIQIRYDPILDHHYRNHNQNVRRGQRHTQPPETNEQHYSHMLPTIEIITTIADVDNLDRNLSELIRLYNAVDTPQIVLTEEEFSHLRKDTFANINKYRHIELYNNCPITYEQFDDKSEIIILQCGHYFSEKGIKQWLCEENTQCPCCKFDVRENPGSPKN